MPAMMSLGSPCKLIYPSSSLRLVQTGSLAFCSKKGLNKRLERAFEFQRPHCAAPPPAHRLSTTRITATTASQMAANSQQQHQHQPFTIVGTGRVGEALAAMGSGKDVMLRRGQTVAEGGLPSGPVVVCTRNDDLQAVVDATPAERRQGTQRLGHTHVPDSC